MTFALANFGIENTKANPKMFDKIRSFIYFTLAVVLFTACDSDPLDIDVSDIDPKVRIEHFDREFYELDSMQLSNQLGELLSKYPSMLKSLSNEAIFARRFSDPLQTLYRDSKVSITEFTGLDEQMTKAFAHLHHYYPNFEPTEIITYLSFLDFEYPVLYIDSLNKVYVATDLYLGAEHPAYEQLPGYLRTDRQPKYMTGDILEEIAKSLIKNDLDNASLLNDMVYWGKILYFKEAMQPLSDKKDLVRYDDAQWQFCTTNEQKMWQYFVKEQLLFSSELDLKRRFISVAPFSKFRLPNDAQTPGMVGRWIGWQIVRSYMSSNPQVSLADLMSDTDATKILRESKYKP